MKPHIPYAFLAMAAACGIALGQAYTTPVGYVTLDMVPGFNFVGLTMHDAPIISGSINEVTASTISDDAANFDDLLETGTSYIVEINNGTGIIQVTGVWSGSALTVAADLTGDVAVDDSYTLRPAATLSSVFGGTKADHKLDIGSFGSGGADQVWFWNGTGFDKYYFDEFGGPGFNEETWVNLDTDQAVNGDSIVIVYTEGMIVSSANGKDVVITGEVKTTSSELNLVSGFNFVSSVAPVGATLGTSFGGTAAEVSASGLVIGSFGAGGADQIWTWNGSGFDKFYFDEFGGPGFNEETWMNLDTAAPVPATQSLPFGYVISAAAGGDVLQGVPESYDEL